MSLTTAAIQSARQSLLLNIYELSSPDVADALMSRIRAGVHVEIIEEGQPVGGISAAARGIQGQLAQAMRSANNGDHFYEMTSHTTNTAATWASKRRFHYDHAKYAVIDGKTLLIGSENYSPTGNPQSGTKGNRGWEVLIHDPAITAEYAQIFSADSDISKGDLVDLTVSGTNLGGSWSNGGVDNANPWLPAPSPAVGAGPVAPQAQPVMLEASEVKRITSPDTSLSGLVDLIHSAQKTLDIEQMTFDSGWGKYGDQSPLFAAVVDAARRGVKVRVILNDEQVFAHPGHPNQSKNQPTIDAFNQLAQSEGLDIEGRTADIKRMGVTYIHNKGMLVDGNFTLISSINWDSNAVLNNREAAVVLTSEAVFNHYAALFNSDWQLSGGRQAPLGVSTISDQRDKSGLKTASEVCPGRLRIAVQVGTLRSSDDDNGSFDSLSNSRFMSDFVRTSSSHTCVLTDTRSSSRTGKNRFIEIRKKSDGTRSALLEGYTPDGKVYSIRTVLDSEGPFDGEYGAAVYDGSGPSRQRLGNAVMDIETQIGF